MDRVADKMRALHPDLVYTLNEPNNLEVKEDPMTKPTEQEPIKDLIGEGEDWDNFMKLFQRTSQEEMMLVM